jgi:hypothetical protein
MGEARAQFDCLSPSPVRDAETVEDKAGVLFPIFHLEENIYKEGNGRIAHFGFSQSAARWLPRMFGFLYLVGVSAIAGILIYVAVTGQWAAWGLIWPH